MALLSSALRTSRMACSVNAAAACAVGPSLVQSRNVWVLKRTHPLRQPQVGEPHKNLKTRRMRTYEVVEWTEKTHNDPLKIVLKDFVEGIGYAGDVVEIDPMKARFELILSGLASYASPEALEWAQRYKQEHNVKKYSSLYASRVIRMLQETLVPLDMSSTTVWRLEPWHVRTAMRASGIEAPEEAIVLPQEAIEGPTNAINKDIVVRVKINGQDEARCRLRIRSAEITMSPTAALAESDAPWFTEEPEAYLESQQAEVQELHRFAMAAYQKELDRLRESGAGIQSRE